MVQRIVREGWTTSLMWMKGPEFAATWCLLAIGLSGTAPAGPRAFNEALRPMMVSLLLSVLALAIGQAYASSPLRPDRAEAVTNPEPIVWP